jgi:dipeptidyl aminopeptidase/acylaminoacyl peptidase
MPIRKLAVLLTLISTVAAAQTKSKLTLDEFFNSVSYPSVEISPDGNEVVIETERADWDQQIFRSDLWLYGNNTLIQLTQSGHDSEPKWSPDGKWIAFVSEREDSKGKSSDSDSKDEEATSQIYLISPQGGEAIPVTRGGEDVHSFAWSADSQTIYFSTRQPWTREQKDEYKEKWKDVVQYRTAERGDTIFALDVAAALARQASAPTIAEKKEGEPEENPDITRGARAIAAMPLRVEHLIVSPDGAHLAFLSNAINQRQEKYSDVELYVLNVDQKNAEHNVVQNNVERALLPANAGSKTAEVQTPRRITHNEAEEVRPHWDADSRHIFFSVEVGDVSGPYRDLQPHLYRIDIDKPDIEGGKPEQWAKDFIGPIEHYVETNNTILAAARAGTEVQLYSATKATDQLHKLSTWPGTYGQFSAAGHSQKIAFIYSNTTKPEEIYIADGPDKLDQAHPITTFNATLAEKDLPQGKPYQWKADDGTTVEGMLIFPPGIDPGSAKAKHLPMFTLIHGGPADADGNHFAADWYDWAALAATHGWLVFRPNYRGSTGYGDKFLMQIVPQLVSRPGKDILAGVDALVKDGIADPDRLTIGGYSYGGYMTNWLITQITRFKAAVTGAGAVEHIGNWGNDDTTYDDAYFLGGRPWEAPQRYHDEAAIFQMDKVKTPTHMVAGADDIRVAVLEDYLLEHALYSLGIPNKLLIFPGEGHSLAKNPWHGKIKVREELKWLEKYGNMPAGN